MWTKLLCGTLLLLMIANVMSNVLIADQTMSRMIELTSKNPYCIIHHDRGVIQNMVLNAEPIKLRMLSDADMTALEVSCRERTLILPNQGGFTYPGTKWCGPGNRASNYKDLGSHTLEDQCCREHDHCPASLAPGECKKSACNKSRYTRSHCDCDARFRRCLQALNTETSNTLGAIYFNVIQVTCFKERRPCSRWQSSYYKCDPTPVFVKMSRYRDRRSPNSLKNLLFLGNTNIAKFNQEITVALGTAISNLQELLNGYNEEQTKELCSQWKFRPIESYSALEPLPPQD